jgi:DNA-binding NtrC family response regulator
VIAATNCDLARRVQEGRFREDLYYRLNVVPLRLPPLRRRQGDIPLLADYFLARICEAEGLPRKTLSVAAAGRLRAHAWPGNVRELENTIETAVILSGDRHTLEQSDFPFPDPPRSTVSSTAIPFVAVPDSGLDFDRTLTEIERSILEQALRKTGGNKKAAASMLGLKRTTLSAKLRTLESSVPACN